MAPSLPTEIIQLILCELRLDGSETASPALYASAISRHWCAVALSTPSLWSTFSFCLRTHHEAMLSTFFERSRQKPLSLTISFDFPRPAHVDTPKLERALTLFLREANRIEHLHLRFFTPMHNQISLIGQFLCFRSSGLKSFEVDSLNEADNLRDQLIIDLFMLLYDRKDTWSERCPALTQVRSTDVRLLVKAPSNMTYLSIKGVLGRGDLLDIQHLLNVLIGVKALTELVIEEVYLSAVSNGYVPLPHLHSLSLRRALQRDGTISIDDTENVVSFLQSLQVPALVSLTIHHPNEDLPALLDEWGVHIPSVTWLAVVPCSSQSFSNYPHVFPGVKELVLEGAALMGRGFGRDPRSSWRRLAESPYS